MKLFVRGALRSLALVVLLSLPVVAQVASIDNVVERHVASIGTMDKLTNLKNRFLLGDAGFTIQGSASQISGKVGILSDKNRVVWAFQFRSNDYPQDKFGFDGKKAVVNRTAPQGRSFLTQFLYDNRRLLEDGIFGGALSGNWAMTVPSMKDRLKVLGSRKVGDVETVIVEYSPRGSDFTTKLFFDRETFRHIRSEHTVLQAAVQGPSVDSSAGQSGSIIKLVEEFSNFKKMGDLTLPTAYRISYSRSGAANISTHAGTSRETLWTINITDYSADQDLSEDAFSISN